MAIRLMASSMMQHSLQLSSLSLVRPAAAAVRLLPHLARSRSTAVVAASRAAAPRSAQPTLSKAASSTVSSNRPAIAEWWPPAQLDGRTAASRAVWMQAAPGNTFLSRSPRKKPCQCSPVEAQNTMSLQLLQAQWAAVGSANYSASAQQPDDVDPWRSSDPRYLGNCPELIAFAELHGGTLTTQQIREWLLEHDEVLAKMGLTVKDLQRHKRGSGETTKYHIDHILPDSKCGLSHPRNYYVMHRRDNMRFGDRINVAKCRHVSFRVCRQVLWFHAEQYGLLAAGARPAEAWLGSSLSL